MEQSISLMRRLKINKSQRRGSILVEAILSIIILSICLTLIIQSMTGSLRASKYAGDYTLAVIAAENVMFDRVEKSFISSSLSDTTSEVIGGRNFDCQLSTHPLSDPENDKINQLDLSIKWNSGKRKNRFDIASYLLDTSAEKKKEN